MVKTGGMGRIPSHRYFLNKHVINKFIIILPRINSLPQKYGLILGLSVFFFTGMHASLFTEERKVVEVLGRSDRQKVSDPTGMVETINRETYKGRYTNLTDILEREAGVRVRRYGGLGSYSTLSIRGSNPNQVRLYMDGIPLNNSQGGEINLSDLGFDNLEKIDIYKSGLTGGYSSSAIGGTVNLVTEKSEKKKVYRVTAGGGSFQTGKLSGFYSNFSGNATYSLFLQKEKSDQNFLFRSDNGTPVLNTLDDSEIRRKNAWFDRNSMTGKFSYDFSKTSVHFLNDFSYRQNGIPGPANNQTEKVKREYIRNTTGISTKTKSIYMDNLSLESRLYYTGERDHLFDPLQEYSYGNPNSRANLQNYGFHILPTLSLLQYNQVLKFMVAFENETFQRDKRNQFDEITERTPKKFRSHTTFQVQDELRFFNKKLIFLPVVQYERYVDRFNVIPGISDILNSLQSSFRLPENRSITEFTNIRLGMKYILFSNNDHIVQWRINGSTEKRIPLFIELFGERGAILGNTTLKPESSKNFDFGPSYESLYKNLKINTTLSFFKKDIKDMILFVPNSQFSLRPENVDSATIRGIEWSFRATLRERWKITSNYTYQRAINTSEISYIRGKFLPLRPLHEWSGILSYRLSNQEFGAEVTFIGASFRDRTNEYANFQPARWLYGCFWNYKILEDKDLGRELNLGLEVRNLLNYKTFDLVGYPLPGRTVYFTLSAVF